MKTTITGKNMVVSPGVSERVLKKTSKMERYLNPNTEIFVRLTREKMCIRDSTCAWESYAALAARFTTPSV